MDHDWAVGLVVCADVGEIKALGEVVVDLHSTELPFATYDVFDNEVNFGSVESGFTRLLGMRDVEGGGGLAQGGLGFVPDLCGTGILRGVRVAQPYADAVVFYSKGCEDAPD